MTITGNTHTFTYGYILVFYAHFFVKNEILGDFFGAFYNKKYAHFQTQNLPILCRRKNGEKIMKKIYFFRKNTIDKI